MTKNKEIVKCLLKKGIRPQLKGFEYLCTSIELEIQNNGKLKTTKDLYPKIANIYNDTCQRVERAIRHAIKTSNEYYKNKTNTEFIYLCMLDVLELI